jgi:hypothetical protein
VVSSCLKFNFQIKIKIFPLAFVLDEKNDETLSNGYLKTATGLAEFVFLFLKKNIFLEIWIIFFLRSNNFYEDLIRCFYIKCDRSKKTNRVADCIKIADQIVDVTLKTKDFLQQSCDLLYVSEVFEIENNRKKSLIFCFCLRFI